MKKYSLIIFVSIFIMTGCVENFDLKLSDVAPRLTVEGLINNKPGPYYIRLTKSKTGTFTAPTYSYFSTAEPVTDAFVTISDDTGTIDTLQLIKTQNPNADKAFHENEYKTTKLRGVAGHTYTLKIKVWGKEFEAKSYMPPVPKIDSLGYLLKTSEKDGQRYYVPVISFKEPQGIDNYYLFQLNDDHYLYGVPMNVWQFSIMSDLHLTAYVKNLDVSLGTNPRGIDYPFYLEGSTIYLGLNSLTKEAYEFYLALIDQFDNDGGAYKPAPACPPTNISNGGLGFFRASAVSESTIKIPKTSNAVTYN